MEHKKKTRTTPPMDGEDPGKRPRQGSERPGSLSTGIWGLDGGPSGRPKWSASGPSDAPQLRSQHIVVQRVIWMQAIDANPPPGVQIEIIPDHHSDVPRRGSGGAKEGQVSRS